MRGLLGAGIGLLALAASPALAIEDVNLRLETRPGVTLHYTLVRPDGPPVALAVLFVGGPGQIGLGGQAGNSRDNILNKHRRRFAESGILVAVPDAPSDRPNGLWDFRSGEAHATDIARLAAELRRQAKAPLWFVGHSYGTVSAVGVAVRMGEGGPQGLVLSSSIFKPSRQARETIRQPGLRDLRQPILLVHHRDDGCPSCPYAAAEDMAARLFTTPGRELVTIDGGRAPDARANPCGSDHYHGYYGKETEVIDLISAWIKKTGA